METALPEIENAPADAEAADAAAAAANGAAPEPAALVSKVLVIETDAGALAAIRDFCDAHGLQGHKVHPLNVPAVLRSRIDLGAVFVGAELQGAVTDGLALARDIAWLRPELPLFLRMDGMPEAEAEAAAIALQREPSVVRYTLAEIDALKAEVDRKLFDRVYPTSLVRTLGEMTQAALASQFKGMQVRLDPPYVVRDRLIHGELFTLIPMETPWCRGFMTLQTDAGSLRRAVAAGRTAFSAEESADFRNLNAILGELTNLVWGAFRNRFGTEGASGSFGVQVPIIVNHLHRYISFGTESPQLCFKCQLWAPEDPEATAITIYQRFAFSLSWAPELYRESEALLSGFVESGELELF
ncbi:chemotaxis protein CheX [Paracidovorax wautersii]|uniref:Chemotaxis phosphatase CheX n=1 Tax=Paracidovorax wautersii TaxID=1177982 RepID=A0A1I2EK99_9BURK|nr:chemotaxis protein CheX [Paracidovorax wautersii]SFE92888.1 Chemotaxis phosphatase CheX [Paracidovorax wautersii]